MPIILPVKDKSPAFGRFCWLAPNATVVGDVRLGDHCSVWFNAVVRGDVNKIKIGNYTNIQDGAVIHCTYQQTETTIGNYVSIAHNAIVHGCTIGNEVLIGMGAIVMDNAVVPDRVIVAAGAIVTQGMVLESGYIYAGAPAKRLKPLTPEHEAVFMRTANNYVEYSQWFPAFPAEESPLPTAF